MDFQFFRIFLKSFSFKTKVRNILHIKNSSLLIFVNYNYSLSTFLKTYAAAFKQTYKI